MPVDYNTAKHICNVVRRQIKGGYPDLHLHFTIHNENERGTVFSADGREIGEHPAGKYVLNYPNVEDTQKIMSKNRTRFVSIARHNSPGFLGFFQQNNYLALCFVNYNRFDSEENLKSHALHIAWHAIALYKEYVDYRASKKHEKHSTFIDDHNLLIPTLTKRQLHHRNLMGDIFSATVQALLGREESLENIAKQRMNDTLTPQVGFRAEQFPFPVCIDTLEFVFKNNINQYKKNKKRILSAVSITEDIGATYESTSIEQWRSFSFPAQQMAWAGYDIETILGAALYTGENTYAQSIADMISETLNIKPKVITNIQDYNPFTDQEANVRLHKKLCRDLLGNLQRRIASRDDYKLILDVIEKQNQAMLEGKLIGWCVPALAPMVDIIRKCRSEDILQRLVDDASKIFEQEIENIKWDTLTQLSQKLFFVRRDYGDLTWEQILDATSADDEFSSIHLGLTLVMKLKEEEEQGLNEKAVMPKEDKKKPSVNISDFISPNAVKH